MASATPAERKRMKRAFFLGRSYLKGSHTDNPALLEQWNDWNSLQMTSKRTHGVGSVVPEAVRFGDEPAIRFSYDANSGTDSRYSYSDTAILTYSADWRKVTILEP